MRESEARRVPPAEVIVRQWILGFVLISAMKASTVAAVAIASSGMTLGAQSGAGPTTPQGELGVDFGTLVMEDSRGWRLGRGQANGEGLRAYLVQAVGPDADGAPAHWFLDENGDGANDLMLDLGPWPSGKPAFWEVSGISTFVSPSYAEEWVAAPESADRIRTWSRLQSPAGSLSLLGVYASPEVKPIAVGALGTVLHYDGGQWVSAPSGSSLPLFDVWGASDDAVVAVGVGTILGFDGTTWRTQVETAWPVESAAQTVALVDLDGNALPDAVIPQQRGVAVLLNDGAGGFHEQVTPISTTGTFGVATGDFDGDGRVDIALSHFNSTIGITVLFGDGKGSFDRRTEISSVILLGSIASADFDGNGTLDLAATDRRSQMFVVLLGDGNGGFAAPSYTPVGRHPGTIAVGDVNRDGHLDAVVYNVFGATISVLYGDGNGLFSEVQFLAGGAPNDSFQSPHFALGDLDGDGNLDAVVARVNSLGVLLGDGDGGFGPPATIGAFGKAVRLADVNGDGYLDLVVAASRSVDIHQGRGDGTFEAPVRYAAITEALSLDLAEIDGDGLLDIAAIGRFIPGEAPVSVLSIHRGLGSGEFTTSEVLRSVWGSAEADVYAVGQFGTIRHFDGTDWTREESGTITFLSGVWVADTGEAIAVGTEPIALRRHQATWVEDALPAGTDSLLDVWGAGDDVFAVGNSGTVLHDDGNGWARLASGTGTRFTGLWGSGPQDILAVGTAAWIHAYDGSTWSRQPSTTSQWLWGISGASAREVFAVGRGGTLLKANAPPIAVAGDDRTLLPGEMAIFDGSASFDPDRIIVSYEWDFDDGTMAHTVQAVHGWGEPADYAVTLKVTNDAGAWARDTVDVKVLSVEQTLSFLIEQLRDEHLPEGIERSLQAKLRGAIRARESNSTEQRLDAAQHLQAFVHQLRAQEGKALAVEQTDRLIEFARRILALL